MAWTSPRTWVADETVTAALMNTHVRDNLKAIGDAWTSYTPTLTNLSGAASGAYLQVGKLVIFRFTVTLNAAATGVLTISIPVTAFSATGEPQIGQVTGIDNTPGTDRQPGNLTLASTTTVNILDEAGRWSAASPWTWASTDTIAGYGMYEAS